MTKREQRAMAVGITLALGILMIGAAVLSDSAGQAVFRAVSGLAFLATSALLATSMRSM